MELTRSKDMVIKPGDQYYETLAIQDDKRIITDLEKRYKEKGLEIEASEIKKEEDRATAIKAIIDANPEMTDAEAAKILDAGGQNAYDLQQREIALQPQIDNARSMLSGFDGGSFLRKGGEDGMSPEAANVYFFKARK